MGYEYAITVDSKNYDEIINMLYNEFLFFNNKYKTVKTDLGFILKNEESTDWQEIMEISINIANIYTYNISEGTKYIYCLFFTGGDEAYRLKEYIRTILNKINCIYSIENL